ncbi:hypothetical protein GGS20DRAFT_565269 [Poronia punctata]|nr:hypothetical protein GGS20DRAFT_565269 [Poronia punctata]
MVVVMIWAGALAFSDSLDLIKNPCRIASRRLSIVGKVGSIGHFAFVWTDPPPPRLPKLLERYLFQKRGLLTDPNTALIRECDD